MRATHRIGRDERGPVFVEIELEERDGKERLSICGTASGTGGQIVEHVKALTDFEPPWTPELRDRLVEVWDRWHLNDMRPGCEHQRDWDVEKVIEFKSYSVDWDVKRKLEREHEAVIGSLGVQVVGQPTNAAKPLSPQRRDALARFSPASDLLYRLNDAHVEPFRWTKESEMQPRALAALLSGFFAVEVGPKGAEAYRKHVNASERWPYKSPKPALLFRVERKAVGWIRGDEHPEGLLSKPCPTCGYEYGTRWQYEPIPAGVRAWLLSLGNGTGEEPETIVAREFLVRWGIELNMDHAQREAPPWGSGKPDDHREPLPDRKAQHWEVELRHGNKLLTFPFWNSEHDTRAGKPLDAYSVLSCLASDSYAEDVDEVAADTDCKPSKALEIVKFAEEIRGFFEAVGDGPECLDDLRKIQ